MTLTPHQQKVFDDIISGIDESLKLGQKFIGSLSGPAGTGKTVMTAKIIQYLLDNYPHKHLRIATPTHKSLRVANNFIGKTLKKHRNFSSSTIHSYLKLKMEKVEDKIVFIEDFSNATKADPTKNLIIDESSMVSESLFNHIKAKSLAVGLDIILFVGDKIQLLPVDGKTNPIFSDINQYELTEVVRQAQDSPILMKATEIRKCIETKNYDMNVLSFDEFKDSTSGIIIYDDAKDLLKAYLSDNGDKTLSAFTNNSVNTYNDFVRKMINGSTNLPMLIEGEQVVLQEAYENNGRFIQNGETVTVYSPFLNQHPVLKINYWTFMPKDEDSEDIEIRVVDTDSIAKYNTLLDKIALKAKTHKSNKQYKEAKEMWEKYWEVKNMFVDIKYNFCHTIHKLQGSTYENVFLNLKETIQNTTDKDTLFRLVYVALTRASNSVSIYR
jgi:exodeoxyribonuclease-5